MRSIWAVAVNTIKQIIRLKIALVFILLLFILLPAMGAGMTGDGTIKGRLQTFISYSLSLTSFLLCFLTIIVSVYSVTSDLDQKQIFMVLTKPIRRFQVLLGKLLGVIVLDMVLLSLFAGLIYAITIYIPDYLKADAAERSVLKNEFFTARTCLKPPPPDVTKQVLEEYNKLEKAGELPEGVSRRKVISRLASVKDAEKRAAAAGRELLWEFNNVKIVDPNQSLFIRFKYDVSVNPPDLSIYSKWIIGDDRPLRYGSEVKTPIYEFDRKDLIRSFYEIQVPADAVAEDGYLAVAFLNAPVNNTVVIFPPDGLDLLYKADSFTSNFIKAVILIFFRLLFLACLGILASTFLSFPVAILLCISVFFTGTISGFIIESFSYLSEGISGIYSYIIKPIVNLLPRFDEFNPAKFLIPARIITWFLVAKVAVFMICIKAFLLIIAALIIFTFREIARIIV